MRKITLSVAALFAFGIANAQDVEFGVKGGLNIASLSGDVEDVSSKMGFHVGGFAEIKLTDKFSVQPELLFSLQGAKEEYTETMAGFDVKYEDKLNLSYLNIPIMAKYYATESLSIQAGPQVGFLMSANLEEKASFEGGSETAETDVKEFMETVDFGVNFGLGYKITENFGVDARYNVGLSNIYKDSDDYKVSNSVIQVSLGYTF